MTSPARAARTIISAAISAAALDFFLTRRDAVTAEVLAHLVEGQLQSRATYDSPMYWTVLFGYKKYWK